MEKILHLTRVNPPESNKEFWVERASDSDKPMLCGKVLNEYYHIPKSVKTIDVIITDKPTRGAYEIKVVAVYTLSSGHNIYKIFVDGKQCHALYPHLSRFVDIHNLKDITLYTWVEYEDI